MAVTWKGGTGNWDSSNWSTGHAPGVADTASISTGTVDVTNYNDIALGLAVTGGTLDITGQLAIGSGTIGGARGAISNSGGTILVDTYGSLTAGMYVTAASGTVSLSGDGSTYQWDGSGSTQTVTFGPGAFNATFQFLTNFGGTISGFGAGQIISYSTINTITNVVIGNDIVEFFDVAGEHDIHFVGNYNSSNLSVSGGTITTTAACYCPNTLILTDRGEAPVEALAIKDTVVTASGQHRPIRWIGRRSYAGRFLATNPDVQPIRFRAGSLGNGVPRRDLLVSPEHAMFLGGALIPAKALVNGSTITQERGLDRVDYIHVELDSHDVIVAEGAPSESFLEDGNRGQFHNAAEHAARYPDAPAPSERCAPWVDSGADLEAIRARLTGIAGEIALAA